LLDQDSRFDLIVIGGGINGAAIAREAALAGIAVLLLERDDFCSGTSATSTRLIHGGLRYLEYAEFSLVRESLAERERLLAAAPHLVRPLEIFLPLTSKSRRGKLTIRLGMWLYDWLSAGKSLPRHRMLSRKDLLETLPGLAADVIGGAAYFDAQVNFAERLVLENALDAEMTGATLAPHTAARELLVEAGRIAGIRWESATARGIARAPVVVNATGPWVDALLRPWQTTRLIGGTRGSHLVVRPFAGAPARAVYAEAASDGRPFFIIPWNGCYLIGTTDERDTGDPGDACINDAEYAYLIAETERLFPGAKDLARQVCYTFSGVRPLPNTQGVKTAAITRRHLITPHPDVQGLYSIVGGKLTTHRALAVDCLRRIPEFRRRVHHDATAQRPLPGALDEAERSAMVEEVAALVGAATADRWWRTYGGGSRRLLARMAASSELRMRVGPETDLLVVELVHALETEHARSLGDLLLRRTMTGLDADLGRRAAPLAADWLVRLGIWDKARAAGELESYGRQLMRFALPPSARGPAG